MQKRMQLVETYDTFRPDFLLDVSARFVDIKEPQYVKTFRSTYLSLRKYIDGALTHLYQDELPLDDKRNELEENIEAQTRFWEQSRQC